MNNINCPKCGEKQWSIADQNYVTLFGICWHENKIKWENHELSLMEFEQREEQASKLTS